MQHGGPPVAATRGACMWWLCHTVRSVTLPGAPLKPVSVYIIACYGCGASARSVGPVLVGCEGGLRSVGSSRGTVHRRRGAFDVCRARSDHATRVRARGGGRRLDDLLAESGWVLPGRRAIRFEQDFPGVDVGRGERVGACVAPATSLAPSADALIKDATGPLVRLPQNPRSRDPSSLRVPVL